MKHSFVFQQKKHFVKMAKKGPIGVFRLVENYSYRPLEAFYYLKTLRERY
jgi:hypothetical protein